MPYNFTAIEKKWQQYWLDNKTFRALEPAEAGDMPKAYVLDMFPYPSGAGLHVGHPEGYTATDIVSRFLRMKGVNVLHPMGWDAFGLPAEQFAIKTNTHPRVTTEKNIQNFRRQIQMLGLSYDWDREVDTTDPGYYKWTQWIFLQIYNSYFDPIDQKAKPIGHLMNELVNENYVVAPDGNIKVNPVHEGMEALSGEIRVERLWRELSDEEKREIIDSQRLAYTDEIPVNWCPALGTVLANEEVIDGKSEVGGYPVEKKPMRQWMLRITAYADRLLKDLETLDWPESLKKMQVDWIGRSVGAEVDFEIAPSEETIPATEQRAKELDEDADDELAITVFTTRPDTLYGATYMVLAPEHPMVDRITPPSRRETVEAYRLQVAAKSERDRMADTKDKTGVFIGAHAINPVNGEKIPIYIADYVLMGYGTGAIMAVPAHDQRDYDFAKKFDIPIRQVVRNPIWNAYPDFATLVEGDTIRRRFATATLVSAQDSTSLQGALEVSKVDPSHFELCNLNDGRHAILLTTGYDLSPVFSSSRIRVLGAQSLNAAFEGEGIAINSPIIDGMPTAQAKEHIIETLEREGNGVKSVKYKLRDWLFSRQRYWGEPFPIALDEQYNTYAIDEAELPLTLPELEDFKPTGTPEPPLSKAKDWLKYEREGKPLTRETNTMPQWAGSCWYYLRYIDPKNPDRFIDPAKEKYWMPVDLYVGGVEHAVLHLLYSRFWHKVLFDLGHVSTPEPFQRLVNQGLILGEVEYHFFESADGKPISASEMTEIDEENTPEFGVRLFGIQKSTGQRIYGKRIDEILVEKKGDGYFLKANPAIRVDARSFKMSKSRGNVMNPDDIVRDYGADCFRLYEMYMGPLEAQKPWNTRDIVGMMRFLNSVWRNLVGDEEHKKVVTITSNPIPEALDRMMHRAIKKVADDISGLRFNTAIAELIKLNNEITGMNEVPRELAENLVLMLAPFAPHMCEELWERLGHHKSLARRPWPSFDASKLIESTMELPVQVNGKLRDKITVDANADENTILDTALAAERVKPWVEGKTIKKKVYVPKKLVNFVVA